MFHIGGENLSFEAIDCYQAHHRYLTFRDEIFTGDDQIFSHQQRRPLTAVKRDSPHDLIVMGYF